MTTTVILKDSNIKRLFFFLLLINKPNSRCKSVEGVIQCGFVSRLPLSPDRGGKEPIPSLQERLGKHKSQGA